MYGEWRSVGRGVGEWGSVLASGARNGRGVGKCVRVWGPIRKDVWGVEKHGEGCGRVYGVSGEVCWRVGKGCG